jgi:hypothetical protein
MSGTTYQREREEIIVSAISSNTKRTLFGDILLQDWRQAGLLFPSTATGIFFTIKKKLVEKRLGSLAKDDLDAVEQNCIRIMELDREEPPCKVSEVPKPFPKAKPRTKKKP